MRAILSSVVTFLATVFTDKPGLGIRFVGIVEVTNGPELSKFHFEISVCSSGGSVRDTHCDLQKLLDNR